MQDHDMNSDNQNIRMDELRAQIALAVLKPQKTGPCPSDEELALLVDKRLDAQKRKAILNHLSGCDDCYQAWLFAAEAAEADRVTAKTDHRRWRYIVGSLVAACLVLFLGKLLWINDDTNQLIADAYDLFLHDHQTMSSETLNRIMALPGAGKQQFQATGYAAEKTPQQQAFESGRWVARNQLINRPDPQALPPHLTPPSKTGDPATSWSDTPYRHYYQLGQWCILLKSACQVDPSASSINLWKQLRKTTNRLHQTFKSADPNDGACPICFRRSWRRIQRFT
jgi:hypothetical protein